MINQWSSLIGRTKSCEPNSLKTLAKIDELVTLKKSTPNKGTPTLSQHEKTCFNTMKIKFNQLIMYLPFWICFSHTICFSSVMTQIGQPWLACTSLASNARKTWESLKIRLFNIQSVVSKTTWAYLYLNALWWYIYQIHNIHKSYIGCQSGFVHATLNSTTHRTQCL